MTFIEYHDLQYEGHKLGNNARRSVCGPIVAPERITNLKGGGSSDLCTEGPVMVQTLMKKAVSTQA